MDRTHWQKTSHDGRDKSPLQAAIFVWVRIFRVRIITDLIMQNYRSNQSALMTRFRTALRHQYGIFGGNRRRPSRETPLGPGAKKDGCFRRL